MDKSTLTKIKNHALLAFSIICGIIALGGFCLLIMAEGFRLGVNSVQQEALKHNAAHYDAKTGQFTWNEPAKEPEQEPAQAK